MSTTYSGSADHKSASGGEGCHTGADTHAETNLRNGAVVVFLEARHLTPVDKCASKSTSEETGPSGADLLLRSGSTTVYLTGTLIYKTAESESRAKIPLQGFAQLSIPQDIDVNANTGTTSGGGDLSEGTLPFALTGSGTINLNGIHPELADGTLPLPVADIAKGLKGRRFLVAVYSDQGTETQDGTLPIPLAGNAWLDVFEPVPIEGQGPEVQQEGTLPFALSGAGTMGIFTGGGVPPPSAGNKEKGVIAGGGTVPTIMAGIIGMGGSPTLAAGETTDLLADSSNEASDVSALQLDQQPETAIPTEGARVVRPGEASLSISSFRYLNDPGNPIDWHGAPVASVSLSGFINQNILGSPPGSFRHSIWASAIVFGNVRTPTTPGNAPGGTGNELFFHPVKLIGNGRVIGASTRPSDLRLVMPLQVSPFANVRFTQGTAQLTWERPVIPGDGDLPYVPFQFFATGNISTLALNVIEPIIDFDKFPLPEWPWTAPPRTWPPVWPPPPPPPPFDPPRPWPRPRPGPGPDPAPEWQIGDGGKPVQPEPETTGPLLGGPKEPGWIDPVPLEPETIGPAIGPVKVGGDPVRGAGALRAGGRQLG